MPIVRKVFLMEIRRSNKDADSLVPRNERLHCYSHYHCERLDAVANSSVALLQSTVTL